MSQQFACPECGKTYRFDPSMTGRKVRCSACETQWRVGESESTPAGAKVRPKKKRAPVSSGPLLPPMSRAKHDEDLIDMTAMVDIVFFLLIFFLVTSIQAMESVMNMPTPESSASAATPKTMSDYQNDPECVMIRVEDDDSIWIDDTQVFGDDEMRGKLRSIRKDTPSVVSAMIVGSADASHGAAVRVFDACAATGLDKLNFTVEEADE
jgi:biopolymer transport protein ExbD